MKWVSLVVVAMTLVSCGTKKKSVSSRQTPEFEWSEESRSNTAERKTERSPEN